MFQISSDTQVDATGDERNEDVRIERFSINQGRSERKGCVTACIFFLPKMNTAG